MTYLAHMELSQNAALLVVDVQKGHLSFVDCRSHDRSIPGERGEREAS